MAHWRERLGDDITSCVSFVQEHTILDIGHTALNRKLLEGLLATDPGYLSALVEAGTSILDAHAEFLADCVRGEPAQLQAV